MSNLSRNLLSMATPLLIAFSLSACGGGGGSTPAAGNNIPTAKVDLVNTTKNQAISVNVLANDTGGNLRIKSVDNLSAHAGSVSINSVNNKIRYTPHFNYVGEDSFWYVITNASGRTDTQQVKVTVTGTGTGTQARFSHVKMHYDLLQNQAMIWGEIGSQPPYSQQVFSLPLRSNTASGNRTLYAQNHSGLIKNQLIVYQGNRGNYYVGRVKSLKNNNQVELYKPLKATVNAGNRAWAFYANPSHANEYGFKAIADFALQQAGFNSNTQGKHLLLGDSWFEEGHFSERLRQKMPRATIINKGEGGNTTYDLLSRFSRDVTPYAPDYIWIMTGTNDYWEGLSTAQFKTNLNRLINQSKALGAKVIVIDASVGEGTGAAGVANKRQSELYVNAVLQLLN